MIRTPRTLLMKTFNESLPWFWIIDGWLLTKRLIICTLVTVISMELFIKDLAFIVFLQDGFQNSSQNNKNVLFYIQPKRIGSPSPRTGGSLRRIVSGEDTWLHHYEPENKGQNMERKCQTLLVKRQFKTYISIRKVMLTRSRDSRDQFWNTTNNRKKGTLVTCSETGWDQLCWPQAEKCWRRLMLCCKTRHVRTLLSKLLTPSDNWISTCWSIFLVVLIWHLRIIRCFVHYKTLW